MSKDSCSKTLRLYCLAAGHGDCILIEYGTCHEIRRVLIDGGTASTFPRLARLLDQHPERTLELLVVTHIDSDHIAGIVKLIEHPAFKKFKDIWFNGYGHLLGDRNLEPFGAQQGEVLTRALLDGRPWNAAFGGKAVRLNDAGEPVRISLPGGAMVTVISPTAAHLAALRPRWDSEVGAAGLIPTQAVSPQASPPDLQRMGVCTLDIDALASTRFVPDTSVSNASSIALVFEFEGRRLLLAGDAFADVLATSARAIANGAELAVDIFKLPHHGSRGNVSSDLLKAIPASTYLVSTNGAVHHHPDVAAMAEVIRSANAPHLAFNYASYETQIWANGAEGGGKYRYTTEYGQGEDGLVLNLL